MLVVNFLCKLKTLINFCFKCIPCTFITDKFPRNRKGNAYKIIYKALLLKKPCTLLIFFYSIFRRIGSCNIKIKDGTQSQIDFIITCLKSLFCKRKIFLCKNRRLLFFKGTGKMIQCNRMNFVIHLHVDYVIKIKDCFVQQPARNKRTPKFKAKFPALVFIKIQL